MSAKKTNKNNTRKRVVLWGIIVIEILALALVLLIWWAYSYTAKQSEIPGETEPSAMLGAETELVTMPQETPPVAQVEVLEQQDFRLDNGLIVTDMGAYTGVYMEDGTDELVSGVLMLVVKNEGDKDLQYVEITVPTENGDAKFSLSTLPVGASCVLLEQNRMAYTGKEDVAKATADHYAVFAENMSLCEDQLKLQVLDGVINVTNISGSDITNDVVIYYKNAAADMYYGGITYRIRIEGGIKADEIKQIMGGHFSESGSKLMFVSVI